MSTMAASPSVRAREMMAAATGLYLERGTELIERFIRR